MAYSVGRLSHRWGFTMLNRKITTSIHYLFTLLLLIFWSVAVNADAIDWMGTQVQVNDSITSTNTMSSTIQSTTEAIATITLVKRTSQLDTTLANQYLNTVADMTTEILARKIIASSNLGQDVTVQTSELLDLQNPDGGFGEFGGYGSTVLDTSLALQALKIAGVTDNQIIGGAVAFLIQNQNGDGSFALSSINQSSIVATHALQ